MAKLTYERLRQLLHYDPETGLLTWRVSRPGVKAGSAAGSITRFDDGRCYVQVTVDYGRYLGHRLAWLYMTGEWPPYQVDHRDRDGLNNKWDNLRAATQSQNNGNRRKQSNNTTGFKGVYIAKSGRFEARIYVDNRRIHLGYYDTPEAAHAAYMLAAKKHFGEYARAA